MLLNSFDNFFFWLHDLLIIISLYSSKKYLQDIYLISITEKIHKLKPKTDAVELEIQGAIKRPPMEKTKRNQKLWKQAKQVGKLLGIELNEATAGGGSDANTTSLYTATLDGLGTPGDGAHATHEHILCDKLLERTALLTLLLLAKPVNP